jgi:cephalosporin-C deacetylase-like acetyl esterase
MLGLNPDVRRLTSNCLVLCFGWLLISAGFGACALAQFPAEHFDPIDPADAIELVGTERLTLRGDIASELVSGVDRFLLKQIDASVTQRLAGWPKPNSQNGEISPDVYSEAIKGLRAEYSRRIGLVDTRTESNDWIIESPLNANGLATGLQSLASDESLRIEQVRWPVFEGFEAHGLLVIPKTIRFGAVLVPDASQLPENLCGNGQNANADALAIARCGGLVVIPQGASRHREARLGRAIMTDQEYLYRSAFILGRHLLGYHVHQNMAAVDLLKKTIGDKPIMVAGWGEGGWIALATGVCDTRIDVTCVSGHFGPREKIWEEPIHRNVHGLLMHFGDAQLAALIAPRMLVIDPVPGPDVSIAGDGGAPGLLSGPEPTQAQAEADRARGLLSAWKLQDRIISSEPSGVANSIIQGISDKGIAASVEKLGVDLGTGSLAIGTKRASIVKGNLDRLESAQSRRLAWLGQLDRWQQRKLDLIQYERDAHWKILDTSTPEKFESTIEPYRKEFREEIIGNWDLPKKPLMPRTRLVYEREKWRGYEVVLDVFDDVIAYGVLLVPKSSEPVSKRPCVVFQHGLEGRPTDTIVKDHPAYHDVSARLAEQGYVVFAPQNLYLFTDRFRSLQRKSNPLGKTLFSTIIAQHEQIVKWLGSRPEVDPSRIAFYGLSYGGKSAMRIPALVPEYCLSICSADFNDWVWKNASTSAPYSYVWTMEYEIFEFDLGRKFNYAEMATLIAPRPFMVERGHGDGVAPDERVGSEFAKVRRMYSARLGLPDRATIEWFNGPHTIHGVGTFEFLSKHLNHSLKAN